jgi:hypothetical protein
MKNLELCNYGVQEMNAGEMEEIDGGGFWYDYVLGLVVDAAIDAVSGAAHAYIDYSMATGGKYVIHTQH